MIRLPVTPAEILELAKRYACDGEFGDGEEERPRLVRIEKLVAEDGDYHIAVYRPENTPGEKRTDHHIYLEGGGIDAPVFVGVVEEDVEPLTVQQSGIVCLTAAVAHVHEYSATALRTCLVDLADVMAGRRDNSDHALEIPVGAARTLGAAVGALQGIGCSLARIDEGLRWAYADDAVWATVGLGEAAIVDLGRKLGAVDPVISRRLGVLVPDEKPDKPS